MGERIQAYLPLTDVPNLPQMAQMKTKLLTFCLITGVYHCDKVGPVVVVRPSDDPPYSLLDPVECLLVIYEKWYKYN